MQHNVLRGTTVLRELYLQSNAELGLISPTKEQSIIYNAKVAHLEKFAARRALALLIKTVLLAISV